MFYLIERSDGYIFIQRYIPQSYTHTTYKVLAGPLTGEKIMELFSSAVKAKTVRQFIAEE